MWYTASLLFKGVHSPPIEDREPLWEESIRLIDATDDADAEAKAAQLGQSGELSYETEHGTLTWKFERAELYSSTIPGLVHGAELFSRFLSEAEVLSLSTWPDDDD